MVNGPFAMTRSKTESSLIGRGGRSGGSSGSGRSGGSRNDTVDEAMRQSATRWLNPVQWNSFSPSVHSPEDRNLSKSMWHLADPPMSLPAMPLAPSVRRSKIPLSCKQQQPPKASNVSTFFTFSPSHLYDTTTKMLPNLVE